MVGMPLPMPGRMPGSPPGGVGGAMAPSPMGGSLAQGMTQLKTGLEFLQKALGQLPMGSEVWSSVHKALGDIGKHMDQTGGAGGGPAATIQQLVAMARDHQTEPQRNAMMSMFPAGGGGGGPPSAPAIQPPPMGMAV